MKTTPFFIAICCALTCCTPQTKTLVFLHTNDTHSQIEPLPDNVKNGNKGGYARRMAVIAQERAQHPDLFLFDAGDFCQGSPYFNFFKGRIEIDAMNQMGYDAATLGNHEFDNGIDTLASILKGAHFPIVCTNYEVTGTALEGIIKPFVVLKRNGVKIGVIGLGVKPDGLISSLNFQPVIYHQPLPLADEMAEKLKKEKHCDLVVCLSHLGFDMPLPEYSDIWLAQNSANIDVIIGGHTHSLLEETKIANQNGDSIVVAQMAKSGITLGKITLSLSR